MSTHHRCAECGEKALDPRDATLGQEPICAACLADYQAENGEPIAERISYGEIAELQTYAGVIPAGVSEHQVDEIYGSDGELLPYGRCDVCGQPDGEDHRHCSRCGDVVGILNSADECVGCEESDDIITDELVNALRDENGLAPTREALKVIADILHIIDRVDADESIDYPGDPVPTAGMYRKAIVDAWSQL